MRLMHERSDVEPGSTRGSTRLSGRSRDDSASADRTGAALAAFVAVEAFALPYLVALGRSIWFTADEWNLLATRTAWNLGDLFDPTTSIG
jgi:hypothetical protein